MSLIIIPVPPTPFHSLIPYPDVEEITTKTGNYKKFAIFVRMLLSALQQRSDSVFVDLLTYSDLVSDRVREREAQSCLTDWLAE